MSSIFAKNGRLYFSVKVDGVWKKLRSEFRVGQEVQAERVLARIDEKLAAGEQVNISGPVTVAAWSESWLARRKGEVKTWKNDEATLRLRVVPQIGPMRLDEVRPRHIVSLVRKWRAGDTGDLAPKSVYSAYSTLSAFFRDAALEDLIGATPCMLKKRELGPKVDSNPEWRGKAQFTRVELEALISDERILEDRRVVYALAGVAGLRHGELAGLRWRNVTPEAEPLGMMFIAWQYSEELPKGGIARPVPIHVTLAGMLAEWKLTGWRRLMGRAPRPDDLVVPLPPDAKRKSAPCRDKGYSYEALQSDLKLLNLRERRFHDLRRTFISLARSNGAQKDILKRATHKPPKEVIEGYTTFEWDVVCREVAKMQVTRRELKVIELAVNEAGKPPQRLSPFFPEQQLHEPKPMNSQSLQQWPSPDSNRDAGEGGGF